MKKTQKSFRKKALLSSLSMLMVATVAVGSATFAWFTTSPTASASGLKMKATAANGLKVMSATQAENSAATIGDPTTYLTDTYLRSKNGTSSDADSIALNPVSLNADTSTYAGYTVIASDYAASTAKDDAIVADATAVTNNATTNQGDYYVENVYAALVGAADAASKDTVTITGLTITPVSGYAMTSGVRVALYYNDVEGSNTTTSLIGVYGLNGATEKMLTESGKAYSATTKADLTVQAQSAASTWSGAEVDTTGKDYFTVIVYLDGEDSNVKSSGIKASDLISSISLNLTLPTTP